MPAAFREATRTDAGAIVAFQLAMALETEALRLDPAVCASGVRAVFDDPSKGRYFVAEEGGTVVGSLMITYEWSDWRDGVVWWIQSVYVVPAARGKKVFSGLYGFIKARVEGDRGVRGLRLYVEKKNASAQRVYAALGMDGGHYGMYEWMKPA